MPTEWHDGLDDDASHEAAGRAESTGHRSPGELLLQWWYTAFPTNYVDEDSTTNDQLWQLVLEARALRAVVTTAVLVVPLVLALVLVAGVLLAS